MHSCPSVARKYGVNKSNKALGLRTNHANFSEIPDEGILAYGRCVQCVMINMISGQGRFSSGCPSTRDEIESRLQIALSRLQHYAFIGITERFDQSLSMLAQLFKAEPPTEMELLPMRTSKQDETNRDYQRITGLLRGMTYHDDHLYAVGVGLHLQQERQLEALLKEARISKRKGDQSFRR
jgi:hypothetical protein